jgi:mannosyltransferase OCH1-like enzyme
MNEINFKKLPIQSLSKIQGWHLIGKNSSYSSNIGLSWNDMMDIEKIPIFNTYLKIKNSKCINVILVNLGDSKITVENMLTKDIYKLNSYKKYNILNNCNKVYIKCKNNVSMNYTKIGNILLVLFNINFIYKNKDKIKHTIFVKDFLLSSGITDSIQYIHTIALEPFEYYNTKNWNFIEKCMGNKYEYTKLLLDQWKNVNPYKKVESPRKSIPKKIHWIWLKKNPEKYDTVLNSEFYKYMKTWIAKNMEYKFLLWTDIDDLKITSEISNYITIKNSNDIMKIIKKLPNDIMKKILYIYKNHPNVGCKSDVLRQIILYYEGGIYSDVNDSACLCSVDSFISKFDYIIGLEPVMYVNNAIIGCCKSHKITKAMIAWLAYNYKNFIKDFSYLEKDDIDDWVVNNTGPIALTSIIYDKLLNDHFSNTCIFPSSWFYPNYMIKKSNIHWLKPVSIFSHYDRRDYL